MTALVRAEWTKLFTRVWIGLLLGACVLTGAFAALLTAFAGDPQSGLPGVGTETYERLAFATASNVVALFLILGIIGMTQEYRHRTATPTFLTTPHRGRVVVAKLVGYALVAVPLALAVLAVNYLVVVVHAGARGAVPSLTGDNLRVLVSSGLALVFYAVIGVGLGALLRNQGGHRRRAGVPLRHRAGDPLDPGDNPRLPVDARRCTGGDDSDLPGAGPPRPWQGGLLLLGYGLLAALLGTVLAVRRDVV